MFFLKYNIYLSSLRNTSRIKALMSHKDVKDLFLVGLSLAKPSTEKLNPSVQLIQDAAPHNFSILNILLSCFSRHNRKLNCNASCTSIFFFGKFGFECVLFILPLLKLFCHLLLLHCAFIVFKALRVWNVFNKQTGIIFFFPTLHCCFPACLKLKKYRWCYMKCGELEWHTKSNVKRCTIYTSSHKNTLPAGDGNKWLNWGPCNAFSFEWVFLIFDGFSNYF